jgi:hypothetical protein
MVAQMNKTWPKIAGLFEYGDHYQDSRKKGTNLNLVNSIIPYLELPFSKRKAKANEQV